MPTIAAISLDVDDMEKAVGPVDRDYPMALEYREKSPPAARRSLVRCVWSLRGRPSDAPTGDPIVSDGCVEVVFNFADPFESLLPGQAPRRQPAMLLVGPTALPTFVRPTGRIDLLGIRLQPWAGAAVLGVPMNELRDRQLDLSLLQPSGLALLGTRLGNQSDASDRLGAALAGLHEFPEHAVDWLAQASVINLLAPVQEGPSVRMLARRLGRSVRTIERTFATHIGLSPRTLTRIIRIHRALTMARAEPGLAWSTVAARTGYYDQAHFVRDFRTLVGYLPSQFRPEPDSLTTPFLG